MKTNRIVPAIAISIVLAVACATSTPPAPGDTTTTAPPPAAATPAPAKGEFKNLQILPKDIPRPELIAMMKGFSRSLGTRCIHCHVGEEGQSFDTIDFASDEKSEKRTARLMMKMTRAINADYIARVNEHDSQVTCWTCHRNEVIPPTYAIEKTPVPLPKEPPAGNPPG